MSDHEKQTTIQSQTWTIAVGAMMSIITGALSAFLTHYLALTAWSTNINYQQRAAIFQKRLDLIERTSELAGKAPGISDVWQKYVEEVSASVKKGALPSHDPALSEKLGEYNGQFRAVLELDALFFGPKTRAAIASMEPTTGPVPYWELPKEGLNRLLSAMGSEITATPVSQSAETP